MVKVTSNTKAQTRAQRLAAVGVALRARFVAAKQAAHVAATQQYNVAQYQQHIAALQLQAQQYAAQYGVAPVALAGVHTQSVRAAHLGVQKHAPSANPGACKAVRAWVAANPTATAAQAKAHFSGNNYINPATVQTQYGVARKALATAQ
jgi:hypothetical protein